MFMIATVNDKSYVREKFRGLMGFVSNSASIYMIFLCLQNQLVGKTFVIHQKSTKTVKVFSCNFCCLHFIIHSYS